MLKLRALRARLYENRFELLMLSLWCVFILNIIFPENIYRGTAQAIYLPIQLLAALVLFDFKPRILRLVLIFGSLLLVGRAMELFFIRTMQEELLLLYPGFFGSLMFEVFR